MTEERLAERTYSLCPVCLRRVPAERAERDGAICLERTCGEHGFFSTPIWKNRLDFREWTKEAVRLGSRSNPDCPSSCGLCASHVRDTCCMLLEVTHECDLRSCRFCFAGAHKKNDAPALKQVTGWLRRFVKPRQTFLQLSGGEPTTREDLPEIVADARRLGCKYIQLNTNGIRLANDLEYVRALADSGLSFVFLQFDGTDDETYRRLRGREMMGVKQRAIENCGRFNLGVTLVPTVVQGVNDDRLGDIVRFAVSLSPVVRGVHFQPVCYMGRIPGDISAYGRLTLDELMEGIYLQAEDILGGAELFPSCCDHPLCGFHGAFVVTDDGKLYALHREKPQNTDCCADAARRNREFIGSKWQRPPAGGCCCGDDETGPDGLADLGYFASRVKSHSFTISGMAFQDAGNMDLERLASCSLHVYRDGATVPFCARYLTPLGS